MSTVQEFGPGGYRFIPAVFQYSSGVAAQPGYEIERVRFAAPRPLGQAFRDIEAYLTAIGRPLTAFAACELRTPAPFSEQGFYDFNRAYVVTLVRWGIYTEAPKPINPVARTNVCPMYNPPREAVMYAFSYTVPARQEPVTTFVLAGGGESLGRGASFRERIVSADDTSPEGMRAKVGAVVAEMERRLALLGFGWADASSTQAYTVQNIGHLVGEALAVRGACEGGLVWSYARPPLIGLEFEMDVRRVARDIVL